ncbi:Ferric reductase transmembrane component 3 [Lachnellula cervina]|uniref:Ferric reductase transmembrane component 3 n=1 Tax=Lachnellula cervina TaxID=1316786 RepID=A0A7D8UPH4_9HELO|nr:Ferric reductase transmembrane component 3 [Lachnellula cervina]
MASTLSSTATAATSSSSVASFATRLNGVNQPMNMLFRNIIWWSLGVLAMLILAIRLVQRAVAHSRHTGAMGLTGEAQAYWSKNRYSAWWKFKRHMLYAPLGKKRHNREIRLSSAGNLGTIPSRFHAILLTIFFLSNLTFMAFLDYSRPDRFSVLADLRGRSGVLAIINMIALIIFAGRNNPLIPLLQISFDTYNLMHRWVGRVVVLEVVIHTMAWALVKHAATGWSGIWHMIATDPFISWGTAGMVAMVLIGILSLSPVRHAFYETFLTVHILLALTAILGTWIHCEVAKLPQLPIIKAVFILWVLDRVARMARLAYLNYSLKAKAWTSATVVPMSGGASRVTLHLPRHLNVKPGTHAYLRFAGLNTWDSHPFSIAWVEHKPIHEETLPTQEKETPGEKQLREPETTTDVSFVIHAQTGMTKTLYDRATRCLPRQLTLSAAMEGPYGGHHSLDSYGHVVLFAGSSGITHQIPFVQHLIQGFNDGTVATRRITLIWIIRDSEHLEWVREWMDLVLKMPRRREILQVKLYVTRPKNPRDIISPSSTVQMSAGRPKIGHILREEVTAQKGAMCVTVCGPGGLADNVREVVREVQDVSVVDFIEESFTW